MLTSATVKLPTEKLRVIVEAQLADSGLEAAVVLVYWFTVCADASDGIKHNNANPKTVTIRERKLPLPLFLPVATAHP